MIVVPSSGATYPLDWVYPSHSEAAGSRDGGSLVVPKLGEFRSTAIRDSSRGRSWFILDSKIADEARLASRCWRDLTGDNGVNHLPLRAGQPSGRRS